MGYQRLTADERKRLDELELVIDMSGGTEDQRDERDGLTHRLHAEQHEARALLDRLLGTHVDVCALLQDALDTDEAGWDLRSDLRKALEAVK